jgi:hypothetical protein
MKTYLEMCTEAVERARLKQPQSEREWWIEDEMCSAMDAGCFRSWDDPELRAYAERNYDRMHKEAVERRMPIIDGCDQCGGASDRLIHCDNCGAWFCSVECRDEHKCGESELERDRRG